METRAFRRQLIAGWLVAVVLVVGIAVTAIIALHATIDDERSLAGDLVGELSSVQRLRVQAEEIVAATRGYLLTGEPAYEARADAAQTELEARLRELRGRQRDPDGDLRTTAVERSARAYALSATQAAARRSDAGPKAVVPFFDHALQARRGDFEASVGALADYQRTVFDRALDRARAVAARAQVVVIAAALAAIALAIALALAVIRKLTAQFARTHAAEAAAHDAAAAREEMLAIVSHDLRNPLHAIMLGTSVLDDLVQGEQFRRPIQIVRNAAERMQHMTDELLEAAQLETSDVVLHCGPCDAKRLLDETRELFQARAATQDVKLVTNATALRVEGDHERLLEVLSNLVGNALKFTPAGGHIVVSAESHDADVRFAVADNGPGIAPDQVPHLFERYWQSHRGDARSGVGLGLYICKRLVEAHHGSIGVASTVGTGTTFWFDVPLPSRSGSQRDRGLS